MLTSEDKKRLRTIIRSAVDGNNRWLTRQNISVGRKGGFLVLNYGDGTRNEFDRLVRGLVIRNTISNLNDELNLIASFPFIRFHNQHEQEAAYVNFQNAAMIEKLDGVMVGVFFDGDDVIWHTRKMICTHKPDLQLMVRGVNGGRYQLLSLIGEFVRQINWSGADRNMTYVFEFLHKASRGRTEYRSEQAGLHLIGARHVKTYVEHGEHQLDDLAEQLAVFRPRLWDAVEDEQMILAMMRDIGVETQGFEGFVFRDRDTGARIKVKDPEYVKWCHMLNRISYKRLVSSFVNGEAAEVIAYFPIARERFEKIEQHVHRYLNMAVDHCRQWRDLVRKNRWTRKQLNLEVSAKTRDKFLIRQIMKQFQQEDDEVIHNAVKADLWRMGGAEEKGAQPGRFMDLVGLTEKDEKVVVTDHQ